MRDEELYRPGGFSLTREALDFCKFAPDSRLIDIGCGKGATARYLRAERFDAIGLDCDPEAIKQAGQYCKLGDSSRLPYQAESVDGLFFECSLSQMEVRNKVLAEARRVLKSGSRLVISDLYFRNEAQVGFLPNRAEWQKAITEAAFTVLLFKDKSSCLAEFTARFLWQNGRAGLEGLCGCDMEKLRAGNCGYFLLIAQKGAG
jgi:ubiquinone/menaquinone biosynthesis C-methylase UbiE